MVVYCAITLMHYIPWKYLKLHTLAFTGRTYVCIMNSWLY